MLNKMAEGSGQEKKKHVLFHRAALGAEPLWEMFWRCLLCESFGKGLEGCAQQWLGGGGVQDMFGGFSMNDGQCKILQGTAGYVMWREDWALYLGQASQGRYMSKHMRKVRKSRGARDWNGTSITEKLTNIMKIVL